MKIGVCTSLDNIERVRDLGFDYLEGVANALAPMAEEEFSAIRRRVADAGIPVPAMAGLFPWGPTAPRYQMFESGSGRDVYMDYFNRTFEREAALGVRFSVFGSGGARRFPATVPYGDACKRVVEVLRWAVEAAAPFGITMVFEPLRAAETNFGNTLCEGSWVVRAADHPNVALLADYYHMASMGEPMSEVTRIGGIRHAHLATRERRLAPAVTASDDLQGFFDGLVSLGTCEHASIEGGESLNPAVATRALANLRAIVAEAEAKAAAK